MSNLGSNSQEQVSFVEEELIRDAAESIVLGCHLRTRVLAKASAAYRRSRRILHMQVLAASVFFFGSCVLFSSYYVSVWQQHIGFPIGGARQSEQLLAQEVTWPECLNRVNDVPPDTLVRLAMSQTDSWALVEAYDALRVNHLRLLRGAL